jgi:tetratricopeptide (TPR) repeat protein
MRQRLQFAVILAGAVLTAAGGQLLPRLFGGQPPQVAGESILATVLGDARQLLSSAFLDKADEYFHGGARRAACEHGLSGPAEDGHEHDDHDHGHEDATAGRDRGTGFQNPVLPHEHRRANAGRDPWRWLNARVHVQEHRHAEGEDARELLPWLWAACRASPQNIQAYESSAYVLESMLKRPRDAAALLEEGIRQNPGSASLEFSLGELAIRSLKDPALAERAFEAARGKCRPAEGEAGEEERSLQGRILFYLGYLALQRGDLARARERLAEAEARVPGQAGTRDLRRLLLEEEKTKGERQS